MKKINLKILAAMFFGLIMAICSWALSIEGSTPMWIVTILFLLGAMIVWNPNKLPMTVHLLRHYLFWPCLGLNLGNIFDYYFTFLNRGNVLALITMLSLMIGYIVVNLMSKLSCSE